MGSILVQERKEKMKLKSINIFDILGGVHISYEIDNVIRTNYNGRNHLIYTKFERLSILLNLKDLNVTSTKL